MFNHVVITRFNVGLYSGSNWSSDKNGVAIDPDKWMRERIDLFEKFCLPSLANQNNKNFVWKIGFDKLTPNIYKDRISEYEKQHPFFKAVFVDKLIRDFISPIKIQAGASHEKYLVTTRVDNDDAISKDFIETIQNQFVPSKLKFINLDKGYVLDLKEKKFYGMNFNSNPFISVIEESESCQTILGYGNHAKIIIDYPDDYISLPDKKYWIQVIHEHNLMNSVRGKVVEFSDEHRFHIEIS